MNYQKRLIVTPPGGGNRSRLSLGTFGTGPANVPTSAGSRMPSTIKSAGPNITTATLGTPVATGSATVHQPFTVAIGDFVASHNPAWFGGLKYYKRAHGDTHVVQVGHLDPQPSSVTWTNAVDLGTGTTNWDIGLSYVGANGEESTIVWPANFDNVDPGALMDLGAGSVTWATLKGDTSGDTTTPIADGANKALTHAGMSLPTQASIQETADANGSYITPGAVYQEQISGMTGTGDVDLDGVPNGADFAKTAASELTALGTVKQLNDGTNTRTASNVAAVVDGSGNVPGSGPYITNTPNTIAYVTDATIEYSFTGTGPYTVDIWWDNGTASTDASVVYPDGTTVNLGHSVSGGTGAYHATGVAAATNFYVVLHESGGTVTLTVQTTPFTVSAYAAYFADGGIIPAAAQAGTPLFTASGSGGSGGISGGGGGHTVGPK